MSSHIREIVITSHNNGGIQSTFGWKKGHDHDQKLASKEFTIKLYWNLEQNLPDMFVEMRVLNSCSDIIYLSRLSLWIKELDGKWERPFLLVQFVYPLFLMMSFQINLNEFQSYPDCLSFVGIIFPSHFPFWNCNCFLNNNNWKKRWKFSDFFFAPCAVNILCELFLFYVLNFPAVVLHFPCIHPCKHHIPKFLLRWFSFYCVNEFVLGIFVYSMKPFLARSGKKIRVLLA